MSTPDRFADLPLILAPALAIAQTLDAWLPEYLRAIERQDPDLELDDLPTPAAARVRHAGIWRVGEQASTTIVWPAGVFDFVLDPDDGTQIATVEIGVLVIAQGPDEQHTAQNLHYQLAATRAILLHRRKLGGLTTGLSEVDVDLTTIDPEDRGRTRAGTTVTYRAPGVVVGHEAGGPPPDAEPREDPHPPWPADPPFETDHLLVTATDDPLDPD